MRTFHFMTVDMSLVDKNVEAENFEGWDVLKLIKELRTDAITPTILITGYEQEYTELSSAMHVRSNFFYGQRGILAIKKLLDPINREDDRIDLRFPDDHRTT